MFIKYRVQDLAIAGLVAANILLGTLSFSHSPILFSPNDEQTKYEMPCHKGIERMTGVATTVPISADEYSNKTGHDSSTGTSNDEYACRQAEAAEQSAKWTERQAWINAAQTLALIATIVVMILLGRWQQRAYLSVIPTKIHNFGTTSNIQIVCKISNHGLSPAYKIKFVFKIGVFTGQQVLLGELPEPTRKMDPGFAVYPHDLEGNISWFNADGVLSQNDEAAIFSGAQVLVLWGVANYRDLFYRHRSTQFCAFTGGPQFAASVTASRANLSDPGFNWQWGKNHNEPS